MSNRLFWAALVPIFFTGPFLEAQDPFTPVQFGPVTFTGSVRDRVENWEWFTPASGDPKYTFDGATIRLGISENLKPFDWMFELEIPILLDLPTNAVAAGTQGQLGIGASYYVANGKQSNAAMVFPKQVFLRFHNVFGTEGSTLQLGRFEFFDGAEAKSTDPTVAAVKRERIQQRLIGTFTYTDVMRAFDGFHYAYDTPSVNYTLVGAVPTRGVYQVDGWGWSDVAFGYASATRQLHTSSTAGEFRVFAIYYDDFRPVTKTDNRPAAVRAADHANIRIWTLGGHYVNAFKTAAGIFDVMGEGALQYGDWGVQQQRAGMADLEAGYQPNILGRLKPWIHGGYYYGSGDKKPNDNIHGTFFQLMPTPRAYARFPFFNMENNVDRFGILTLHPHPRFTIHTEAHALRLASGADLWYTGGGVFQPWTFGYQGRVGNGSTSLANLYDVNVDVTINSHFSITPYYGYAEGKSVIEAIYPKGKDGHLAFLEANLRF
jgi:alginate export protein